MFVHCILLLLLPQPMTSPVTPAGTGQLIQDGQDERLRKRDRIYGVTSVRAPPIAFG